MTSVAMAMEEPHDSVLHDVTASILEESLEVKYKNKKNQENTPSPFSKIKTSTTYKKLMSHLEPLKIRNSIDGRLNKASSTTGDLADNKGDIMQKMESIHQDGKALEECNISSTTTTTATMASSDDDNSLLKQKTSANKESIIKTDYGHLNRGTCSSPKDVCVLQNNAKGMEKESSYAVSGYCVSLLVLEKKEKQEQVQEQHHAHHHGYNDGTTGIQNYYAEQNDNDDVYKKVVVDNTTPIDKIGLNEEDNFGMEQKEQEHHHHGYNDGSNGIQLHYEEHDDDFYEEALFDITPVNAVDLNEKEERTTSSYYYYYHPQRDLLALDCAVKCPGTRPIVNVNGDEFKTLISNCNDENNNCTYDGPINCWNTSKVNDMSYAFYEQDAFNDPIECWDTSAATNMYSMFNSATSFNQPVGDWNTSQVKVMGALFDKAYSFNQPIGEWDTSQATNMYAMFYIATSFDQPIGNWNLSQVQRIDYMFGAADAFNQPIDEWNTSQATKMNGMFYKASSFDQPIGDWNTSQVYSMKIMFELASAFNQPIGDWDVSEVTIMDSMFEQASVFNQPVDTWDVSQVTSMRYMFEETSTFNQPVDTWDVSQINDMYGMFYTSTSFNQCLSTWAEKTSDDVDTNDMLQGTDCPIGFLSTPDPEKGPWCQGADQQCISIDPSNCNDDPDFKVGGKKCKQYLKKKKKQKCKKKFNGESVANSCPSFCKSSCQPCKDKSGKIRLKNGKKLNCKKIKKKKQCDSKTKAGPLANESCPVACNLKGC
jgi:hypothetical protein